MQCYSVFFQKQTQPPHFSSVFSVKTLGGSKKDTEIWTVVTILQHMTETKPKKILLSPFYYYEEVFFFYEHYTGWKNLTGNKDLK